MENIYSQRLEMLRTLMRTKAWDAVIITGSDPHSSEYPALRWKQVEWLSGFTGEAGDLVVTLDHAGLWTDTRYFIQARRQLDGTGIELHKTRVPEQVLIPEWLEQQFGDEGLIAVDGLCVSADWASCLPGTVISVPDMLGVFWQDRPQIPQTPVFSVECGQTRASKFEWLRSFLRDNSASGILLSALDEIAWMLNVRASDIEYNPLVLSYLLVTTGKAVWFVEKGGEVDESSAACFSILESEGREIAAYGDTEFRLAELLDEGRLLVDPGSLNYSIYRSLVASGVQLEECTSPVGLRKAVKNGYEIDAMRRIHVKDGVAMEKFLYWLEKSVRAGRRISEWDAAVKLGQYRAEIGEYRGDSFETISAYGPGAALPHYVTPHADAPLLEEEGLYLCDSGGQYTLGTTDITRTVQLCGWS